MLSDPRACKHSACVVPCWRYCHFTTTRLAFYEPNFLFAGKLGSDFQNMARSFVCPWLNFCLDREPQSPECDS